MQLQTGKIILNGAPSQYDRFLPALAADYAPVDGRSFAELLDFPIKFGALIHFYGLDDRVDGDWVGFFASDTTMVLAALITADLDALEREFMRLERLTLRLQIAERKFELLSTVFGFIQAMARSINDALTALDPPPEGDTGRQLWQLLVKLITSSLRTELQKLKDYAEGAGLPQALGRPVRLDWSGFLGIWQLHDGCPDGAIYRGRSFGRKIDHAVPYLVPIFVTFRDALGELAQFARANLEASLAASDHKPQIGLFIAFARLFQTAQATINQTSDRYRRFYYEDMLRGKPAGPVADEVYLTFELAPEEGVSRSTVPAETLFPAGQEADGRDILYASDQALTVVGATLARVRALRQLRGPLTLEPSGSPPKDAGENALLRVLGSEIALAEAAAQSMAWPLFGADTVGVTEVMVTTPATLGFAVATPYLLLAGGRREVQLIVGYGEAFLVDRLLPQLMQLAAIVGGDPAAIFCQILEGAFIIEASTATGWFEVAPYTAVVPYLGDPNLTLCFTLPPTAPPIVAIDTAAAASDDIVPAFDPAPGVPTLKLQLRQEPVEVTGLAGQKRVYPLALLDGMELETLEVATVVAELAGAELVNTDGPIDQASPFPLFGSLAAVGCYLEIRHEELFVKRIETLSLGISWLNLPQNADGFKGYYRDYTVGLDGKPQPDLFDNAVFRVAINLRDPGPWIIAGGGSPPAADGVDGTKEMCLFRTAPHCDGTEPAAPLCAETVFDFGICEIADHDVSPYYQPADSALVIRLTTPPYGFGNDLYSINVLNAVIAELPDADGCRQACEAECAVLKIAAAEITGCIDECSEQPDDRFRDCIANCLAGTVETLLQSAVECLWSCLVMSRAALGATRFAAEAAAFEAARTTSPDTPAAERVVRLRRWIEGARVQEGIDLGCLNKCISLLEAIVGIILCQTGCAPEPPESYRACILSGLRNCVAQLDAAYALCFQQCVMACMKPKQPMKYPNAPWLPMAQSVRVGYSAHCVILGGAASLPAEPVAGRFFHLLPFGGYAPAAAPKTLLPVFPDEGSLYLGCAGLAPPQRLTLLFTLGTSQDNGGQPQLTWDLLCADRWVRLEAAQIASDGTNGLQNTGILALNLPAGTAAAGTVMPGENRWLRASVRSGAARFPPAVAIIPNALTARRQAISGSGETLGRPLPPHTITDSVEPLPDIAGIDQPLESFGGRPPETAREFQIRLGERLRHKDRAVLGWDYERLVLQQFPMIWQVQALPARAPWGGAAPAHVLVVVVPGADSREVLDPTAPTASPVLLEAIRAQLQRVASPFVRLAVVNPVYVRIEVMAVVGFADGEDPGAAIARLNDELVRYLSPWFYDAARAALGGRYVDEDAITVFIETRPYVEEVWELQLCYDPPSDGFEWCFLTSAREHRISQPPMAAAIRLLEGSRV